METIQHIIQTCEWSSVDFFFFSPNVFSPLVYYSHLFPVILSLVIGAFIFFGNRARLANKVLFITTILFSLWSLFDLVLWATPNPADTVFFWSLVNMIEPFVYVSALYFLYAFIEERLPSITTQGIIGILVLPTILLAPTVFNIAGFNLTNCDREAVEGMLVYYNYLIEIVVTLWIIGYGIYRKQKVIDPVIRKQIVLCVIGLSLFLFSFAFGNIIGSVSVNWVLGQVGLFGLPIFIAFLAVLVGRYHSFKTKVFSAEILVVILWVLIISMLFVQDFSLIRSILMITLGITLVLGTLMIRSVKREISQKEELKTLNSRLKDFDAKKNEFLSFATHQLRSPLTAIKWGLDSLSLKYDKRTAEHLEKTTDDLIGTVNDLLDISKIEQGGLVLKKEEFDFLDCVGRIAEEFRQTAHQKGLKLLFEYEHNHQYIIHADQNKLRQVVVNLIDNAIKYTQQGNVTVRLAHPPHTIILSVRDTGPGIAREELAQLFDKFLRGAAGKASQTGSGLGLFLAKKIVTLHGGELSAISAGLEKGSEFRVELPVGK